MLINWIKVGVSCTPVQCHVQMPRIYLSTRHHEFNVKHFIVHKVAHQCLKATFFTADIFETIERLEDDFVTTCEMSTQSMRLTARDRQEDESKYLWRDRWPRAVPTRGPWCCNEQKRLLLSIKLIFICWKCHVRDVGPYRRLLWFKLKAIQVIASSCLMTKLNPYLLFMIALKHIMQTWMSSLDSPI